MATYSTDYTGKYYITTTDGKTWFLEDNNSTGRHMIYGSSSDHGMTVCDPDSDISKAVTKKDLKMMKDEVRKYMQEQMVKDAKNIAGQLFKDIELLKKEKTQLKKSVTELKSQVKQAKKDIAKELTSIEELLEKRVKEIGRFGNLDFSK